MISDIKGVTVKREQNPQYSQIIQLVQTGQVCISLSELMSYKHNSLYAQQIGFPTGCLWLIQNV